MEVGFYVRVNGETKDILELNDEEVAEFMKDKDKDYIVRSLNVLKNWISTNVNELKPSKN